MDKKYKSRQLMAIHEAAADMYSIGLMSDEDMLDFDKGCLVGAKKPRAVADRVLSVDLRGKKN
jgi:DNA-binding transcriptional regulator YiaG